MTTLSLKPRGQTPVLLLSVLLAFWCGAAVAAKFDVARGLVTALEHRFDRVAITDWDTVTGLVVPCGNPSRTVEAMRLAREHPHLKVLMSGPGTEEASIAAGAAGVDPGRVSIERMSRNTFGNALIAKRLIDPKPGERWLLVTSASHMPRAIGSFYRVGFRVEPWPVDDGVRAAGTLWSVAVHEWLGLAAYWVRGRSFAILPGRGDL